MNTNFDSSVITRMNKVRAMAAVAQEEMVQMVYTPIMAQQERVVWEQV